MLGPERERHRARLARLERDPLEALQLLYRPGHGADHVANIELHDLVARALAVVRDVDADLDRAGRADRGRRKPRGADLEARIRQAPAEWKQRLRGVEQIAA